MQMNYITNTTVLSNFSLIKRLDILKSIFSLIWVTTEVREELVKGYQEGYEFLAVAWQEIKIDEGWLRLIHFNRQEELDTFFKLTTKLHSGEASGLSIAYNRKWLFLTDDMDARKLAKSMQVEVAGTIGILVLAVEQQIITIEIADKLLNRMIQGNYRSPISSISDLLTK